MSKDNEKKRELKPEDLKRVNAAGVQWSAERVRNEQVLQRRAQTDGDISKRLHDTENLNRTLIGGGQE